MAVAYRETLSDAKVLNRVFVQQNPVNFIDPWGLAPGDLFKTQDAAAIDALDYYRNRSKILNKEIGGFIYKDCEGSYSYTRGKPGTESAIDVSTFYNPPEGTDKLAIYHTHLGDDYQAGFFSMRDQLTAGTHDNGVDIYLGTGSRLIKVWSPYSGVRTIRQGY